MQKLAEGGGAEDPTQLSASYFEEAAEVQAKIGELVVRVLDIVEERVSEKKELYNSQNAIRMLLIVLRGVLERYQEQPVLLDPHLETLVALLLNPIRQTVHSPRGAEPRACAALHPLFVVLYVLCKVRGPKTVVKFFSHEAADLEPVLAHLLATPEDFGIWESRYILLLWLSLVVMIPFDLKTIDSSEGVGETETTGSLVDSIVEQGKLFLGYAGKEYEGAAILLTRLLTRRDTVESHLAPFLNWCTTQALEIHTNVTTKSVFLLRGILYALCTIYKLGPRASLLPTLPALIPLCNTLADGPAGKSNSLIKKLIVKLTQRVGLCFLKPKLAVWRYQRGSRSLAANLAKVAVSNNVGVLPGAQGGIGGTNGLGDAMEEEEDDVPEEIEDVIQIMLNGLRDKDTIVRWSAAKGVGRISGRLSQEFATEIVASVIALFQEDTLPPTEGSSAPNLVAVSDSTWHGACLAVAELSRRGLLMPEWLEQVVPWVSLALSFDIKRGSHSIGAHVRDAANYVCWSFFRAYDPTLLLPHISVLSRRLIVSATLDREVNVRRAASAAFQEGVGRLGGSGGVGGVPNGIDIVTIADYFSVGNRNGAVMEVAVALAERLEYRFDLIQHIADVMIIHWDPAMRVLASRALYKMAFVDLDFVLKSALPGLIPKACSSDLAVRHGACLALGEICLAWSQIRKGSEGGQEAVAANQVKAVWWTDDEMENFIQPITAIVPNYPQNLLDTFGGDSTRTALCRLVECLSNANWPSTYRENPVTSEYDEFILSWWTLVHSSLENRDETVQSSAAAAMASLANYCWPHSVPGHEQLLSAFVEKVTQKLRFAKADAGSSGVSKQAVGQPRFGGRLVQQQPGSLLLDRFPRRGYALATGFLPKGVLQVYGATLIQSLVTLVQAVEGGGEDAEARRNAVTSIVGVYEGLGVDGIVQVISKDLFQESMESLFVGMEDYSVDSRGDVGSWVRESCFKAWPVVLPLFSRVNAKSVIYLLPETSARAVKGLLRQSVEKIDRVRETAGVALHQVIELSFSKDLGLLLDLGLAESSRADLRKALDGSSTGDLNWLNTATVYPRMVSLLKIDELRQDLLLGLVVSVGGISESLVRYSTYSFTEFVNSLPTMKESATSKVHPSLESLISDFVSMFSRPAYIKDRISVSLIEVTDVLIGCGAVAKIVEDDMDGVNKLFDAVKREVFKCRDVKKLLAAIKVFIGMATLPGTGASQVRQKALTQLVIYLAHTYPRVRRASSEGLYVALTTGSEGEMDDYLDSMELIEDVLLTTDWDLPVAQLKEPRAKVAGYLNVKLPVPIATNTL
ncbi:tubulin folding cofactor D C terminal-domain-containing protein [Chytriomyces sp. MP71]|nr:tubulin folding cofactor D C terminal-domain-containing protein [Chytriomyces sp. MP71]